MPGVRTVNAPANGRRAVDLSPNQGCTLSCSQTRRGTTMRKRSRNAAAIQAPSCSKLPEAARSPLRFVLGSFPLRRLDDDASRPCPTPDPPTRQPPHASLLPLGRGTERERWEDVVATCFTRKPLWKPTRSVHRGHSRRLGFLSVQAPRRHHRPTDQRIFRAVHLHVGAYDR